MTRSDEPLFEPRIADWLEDDPYTAPDQALDVVLAAFPSIKQRRALRVPWRVPGMNTPLRLGLTAAAVGAVAIGSLFVVNRGASGPGGPGGPTPSATPAPTATPAPSPSPAVSADLLDVSTWTAFTSSRYGFSLKYPATFEAVPSVFFWRMPDTPGNMFDGFRDEGAVKWLNGVSMLLPVGATRDEWYAEYRRDVVEDENPWEPRILLHAPGGLELDDHRRRRCRPSSGLRGARGVRLRFRPGLPLRCLRLRRCQSSDRRAGRLG